MKQKAKIKEWRVEHLYETNYVLVGKIIDHPRLTHFTAEEEQMTSGLISIDFKNNTAETLNTIYTLENSNN